ncbi:MAG TPA: glycosyltransferase family 39 protein [Terriglobales bacterium]|jgi:4-amino-4-deoxy-L-arabinose transferase-like glycosyltransferase|nr:glycosyltransferase family 39 protein [Terriglobales bacterium]
MKNSRRILLFIWIVFVLRGVFYSAVFPIWEGYDEPFHFAYLQQLIHHGEIPGMSTPMSRELLQSLHVLPLPWVLSQEDLPQPAFSHEAYWKLSGTERERLQKQFREIPPSWGEEDSTEKKISNYETQQMPLYYLVFYFPLKLMPGFSLALRVLVLRFLNVLLASCIVPLGYLVATRVLKDKSPALSLMLLIVALPELFIDLSRVGNESLALVLYTAAVYLALRIVEGPQNFKYFPWLGVVLSLGLLTKAYFLTAVPALFPIIVWCYRQWPRERNRLLKFSTLTGAALLIIAGPWYWRVHTLTGSWSGVTDDVALRSLSRWQILAQVPHVNWAGGIVSILLSHVWFGAWSFLKFNRPVYLFFGLIILLAVLGICRVVLLRLRKNSPDSQAEDRGAIESGKLLVLLSFYAFFWLGLIYDILLVYIHLGVSASTGWYMYSLIVPEAILLYLGLSAVVTKKNRSWILPTLTSLFVLLDLYGLHFLLVPYYTGVISHVGQNRVAAAGAGQLIQVGIAEFARRLSINKPAFLGPAEMIVLWIIFLLATVFLIFAAFGLRKASTNLE